MKAYIDLAAGNGYNVVKSLLVAPDFSDEFVNDGDLDFELNISLITSDSLLKILDSHIETKTVLFFLGNLQ